ncbi:protein FAM136A-like [Canis lupus familiaris]|uniref:Protein FAM136A n=1 Tax=Canis lupus familiaris TaxID=9615 RepID=A0A8I3ML85_CANLF|nr:protein FAM136A-like [Canis lupus familiaris]
MAELQQLQVQEVVDSVVKSLERENIRKMQGLTFRCSASCCEDSQASMQQVHQCIERCHVLLAQAQALVTSELEKFQDRLARCTMHCNDKAKDSIDAGSKELQVKRQLESCVTKCVDDHMHLIPTMTKKMKECLLSIGKRSLCNWPSELTAGIYLKRNKTFCLLSDVYEEIKVGSKFEACVTCLWTLVPLRFNPRK